MTVMLFRMTFERCVGGTLKHAAGRLLIVGGADFLAPWPNVQSGGGTRFTT